jgi:hypothetical protein
VKLVSWILFRYRITEIQPKFHCRRRVIDVDIPQVTPMPVTIEKADGFGKKNVHE